MNIPASGDRRMFKRFTSVMRVHVRHGKERRTCDVVDVCATGVSVEGLNLGLKRFDRVELRLVLRLNNGIARIHARKATIIHTTKGRTGFAFDQLQPGDLTHRPVP